MFKLWRPYSLCGFSTKLRTLGTIMEVHVLITRPKALNIGYVVNLTRTTTVLSCRSQGQSCECGRYISKLPTGAWLQEAIVLNETMPKQHMLLTIVKQTKKMNRVLVQQPHMHRDNKITFKIKCLSLRPMKLINSKWWLWKQNRK